MTKAEHPFSIYPTICEYPQQCRHKKGGNPHRHKYKTDLLSFKMKCSIHITPKRGQVRSPYEELQEVQDDKTQFYIHHAVNLSRKMKMTGEDKQFMIKV